MAGTVLGPEGIAENQTAENQTAVPALVEVIVQCAEAKEKN